ncbi:DeoR/GlpR transcriptional regulator [Planctomonas sp. JC2975]|uniref:DeoR/GlpR family DNA-binding transcription regulator n=1 Tax=Planctomonas sp. JC2975 TaxID=2729626 RepID=UPI0014744111|nr:DeoR/GlpR family DNA-binding transcription regulator [Planctomonas sp. JC2975]NNC11397.1 DeoR/GlpR transcriptional regulator [Planctomonas sp. JC2975]
MLAAARQSAIVARARERGTVRVTELAAQFAVSEMTVRRDIDVLVTGGLLERVHGGATLPGGGLRTDEPGFETKIVREELEKLAIAREAASLVQPGSAIGISAGTTTWRLASILANAPLDCTVVTNSVQVASVLFPMASSGRGHVILTGGERTPSDALVGPIAISALRQLHLDYLFLGVHGMDEHEGFTTPNLLEAEADRALVAAARRVVVLADHTKWGTVGMSTIAELDEAAVVISDDGLGGHAREILSTRAGELRIVTIHENRTPSEAPS